MGPTTFFTKTLHGRTVMKLTADTLEAWLAKPSRVELSRAILESSVEMTLPQARQLTTRLNHLEPPAHCLRLGFVHTYTSHLLDPWLSFESAVQGMDCAIYHAPY